MRNIRKCSPRQSTKYSAVRKNCGKFCDLRRSEKNSMKISEKFYGPRKYTKKLYDPASSFRNMRKKIEYIYYYSPTAQNSLTSLISTVTEILFFLSSTTERALHKYKKNRKSIIGFLDNLKNVFLHMYVLERLNLRNKYLSFSSSGTL